MSLIPGISPVTDGKRKRSWLRRLAYGVLVLTVVFTAFVGWAYWHGNQVIRDAIAEVEKTDPNWRIQDIEANRRPVPDAENSALVIMAGKKLIDNSVRDQSVENGDDFEVVRRYPNARFNEQQLASLPKLMKPYVAALEEWKKIEHMPYGRFPIKYSPDFIGTLLGVQDARDCGRYFQYDLWQRVEAGDREGAVRAMKCSLHVARSVGDEPLLISILVRIAIQAIANNNLEWLLAQVQLDETDLAWLQRTLEEDMQVPLLTTALRGERAGSFECFEHMKRNRNYAATVGMAGGPIGGTSWRAIDFFFTLLPGSVSVHQADALRYLTQAVEVSKLPTEQQPAAVAQLEKDAPKLSFLARLLVPATSKVAQASVRWQAQLRTAIVAIAAERYRLRHGRWPDGLKDLVAEKLLKEIPNDPFDGKPLRWKVVADGRIVYSVGKDQTDNYGHLNPDNPTQDGTDLGFRLFDPDKRRQAPRPVKPKIPDPPE